ncbi:MAG: hypothetical protein RIR70_2258 [Pseudomonadota bacterium]|jgi:hypothetical protein
MTTVGSASVSGAPSVDDSIAQMKAMQAEQLKLSMADREFQMASATIEKGDKATEKVGDRIAN